MIFRLSICTVFNSCDILFSWNAVYYDYKSVLDILTLLYCEFSHMLRIYVPLLQVYYTCYQRARREKKSQNIITKEGSDIIYYQIFHLMSHMTMVVTPLSYFLNVDYLWLLKNVFVFHTSKLYCVKTILCHKSGNIIFYYPLVS